MASVVTLDSIVRNFLMRRKYSIHFYIECLVYSKDCLRNLSADDLKTVKTRLLKVNDYNACDLPDDYMDYIQVGVKVGQNIKPLVETDKINPLINRNSSFTPIKYNQTAVDPNSQVYYGALYPFYWHTVTWNGYGENIGRMFGSGAGAQDDVFSVFPERNQIQLTENMTVDYIVLQYISDGMDSDAATQITPYAYETISAYIMWQMKANTRTYSAGEAEAAKQEYIDERKILRARMSDLNTETFTRLLQKANYGSPKSK